MGVFFPVASVEICNANHCNGFRFETADIDAHPVGVGSRNVEGFDPAVGAETVLGDTCVEGVGGEILLALHDPEVRSGHDQVEIGGHRTDRAVAEFGVDLGGRLDLDPNPAAVTTALVFDEVSWCVHGGGV